MPGHVVLRYGNEKPGVTRQLLWMEYKAQAGDKAMGYSHFCRCYRSGKTRRLSMRQEHRAGEKLLSTSVVLRFLLLIRTPVRYAAWQSSWP